MLHKWARTWWRRLQRSLRLLAFISLVLFVLLWALESKSPSQQSPSSMAAIKRKLNLQKIGQRSPSVQSYAFATLLCDDVMIDAIKVLIHSFVETKSPHPFIVLALPGVTQIDQLERLGAKVHVISALEYPFKVTLEKAAINKMCRYSKLHIWKFVQYRKIIFIDVDCLIVQRLDNAFRWPEFSAVRDAGDTYNTGLFVLEPSMATYKRMLEVYQNSPSYNQGDQGFLNWFFRNSVKMTLPVRYNTMCKHKTQATWPLLKRQAKMIHYTSETKPWNFFSGSHRFWKQNYDPFMFYQWTREYRKVTEKLRIDVFDAKKPVWVNAKRQPDICESIAPLYDDLASWEASLSKDHLSLLFFKWRSVAQLQDAIAHYRSLNGNSTLISKIYLNWNPSMGTPPIEINRYRLDRTEPQVELLFHRHESWNNLWAPIPGIKTKGLLLVDDEHLLDQERLEIAMETWRNSGQLALVGFFARYHGKQRIVDTELEGEAPSAPAAAPTIKPLLEQPLIVDDHWHWSYNLTSIRRPRPYSLLSPHLLLLNVDYLFAYSCLLPERIHRFIDEQGDDFSDLAMNLLVAGTTAVKPVLVKGDFQTDPETPRYTESYATMRASALKELMRLFTGGTKDTLQYNAITVGQFNKIPFKKRSAKQWNHS